MKKFLCLEVRLWDPRIRKLRGSATSREALIKDERWVINGSIHLYRTIQIYNRSEFGIIKLK
jgi:hypothetical protein